MKIILPIAVGVALIVFGVVYATYRITFYQSRKKRGGTLKMPGGEQYKKHKPLTDRLIEELRAIPFEEITVTSRDGKRLYGRYYHVKDGAPLAILMHGYRGNAIRDFCGGHKLARESGHNILLVDQRAHGKSDGHTITFGIRESEDCLVWAEYAAHRFPQSPIYLSGVSMGASTVLTASALPLPPSVRAIVADCPFSSPTAIIRKVMKESGYPRFLFPFLAFGARLFGRFSLSETSAVTAVKNARVPILFIHGEEDLFVPSDMSRELYQACTSPKRLLLFEGAGHGLSYMADSERYIREFRSFLRECGIE